MDKFWVRIRHSKAMYVFKEDRNLRLDVTISRLIPGIVIHVFDQDFTFGEQSLKVGSETFPDIKYCEPITLAQFIALKLTDGELYENAVSS